MAMTILKKFTISSSCFAKNKRKLLEKLENIEKTAQINQKHKKGKNRVSSAKRRRKGENSDKQYNIAPRGESEVEFIKTKNSNIEL